VPSVYRTTVTWSGFVGAPGVTRFHWQGIDTSALRDAAAGAHMLFLGNFAAYLPAGLVLTCSPNVDIFDMDTGTQTESLPIASMPSPITGSGSGSYAGGSGLSVTWNTTVFFHGRRVRGRTYIVPCTNNAFDSTGTLSSAVITLANSSANGLIATAGADFCIWGKRYSAPPASEQVEGVLAPVMTATVRDMAAQLRTRKT
jgi:hypothetical protein